MELDSFNEPEDQMMSSQGEVDSLEDQEEAKGGDLDYLLDIPMTVKVELGNTEVTMKEVLQFGQGSVLELDKLAGEPLEIFVNNTLSARGEVVVVNDRYGIRMTDIISPFENVDNENGS